MDISELEDFKLSDAVKFHNELNPNLWENNKLKPEVKKQLLKIANDFILELGVAIPKIQDITISGSNAAYSYTPYSDLDLHILVDFNKLPDDEIYQELFTAKKNLYNDEHDISVHGVPVELYVQDSNQPHVSLGEYSIVNDDWIRIPKKQKANFDQNETKAKYEKLGSMIELALKSNSLEKVEKVLDVLKRYRKAGLQSKGEFGPENLSYKALRKLGYIQKLYDYKNELHSNQLSISEVLDTKTKSPFYKFDGGPLDRAVPFKTKSGNRYEIEFINSLDAYSKPRLRQFPKIKPKLIYYKDDIIDNGVEVVFRQDDYMLDNPAGITGAGSAAEVFGIVTNKIVEFIKKFNPPFLYFTSYDDEPSRIKLYHALLRRVVPTLSGYFYKAIKIENRYQFVILDSDFFEISPNVAEDYDPNGPPPGPEFPPTMPAGTIRVDVSDVYDWYKLGQHISNMKGLGKHDFGKGPPSTILSFGDEDLEHQYIDALKKTGLDTTDIDPKGHEPMKGQKVDPTFNVNESKHEIIEGTNCKNCVWWKKDSEKPVGKDELNTNGGLKPPNKEYIAMSKRVDLVTLPGKDTVKVKGFCYHKDINDWVTERMCCAKWDAKGVIRDYKGESPLMEENLDEASGYIPSEKEKNDPRFKTALTVDVKPDSILSNAKAFKFKTSRAGIPPTAKTNGKL